MSRQSTAGQATKQDAHNTDDTYDRWLLRHEDANNLTDILPSEYREDVEEPTIEIPLTQGQVAIVSACDSNLARLKWHAGFVTTYSNGGNYIARRNVRVSGKCTAIIMHRIILERILRRPLKEGEEVDHIDRNPLNNKRANLRLATKSQNRRNCGKRCNNTSGYKGVSFNKRAGKWQAKITFNKKQYNLGYFTDPYLAYMAYCAAAETLHGKFACYE